MSKLDFDGAVVVSTDGTVWRVYEPSRWALVRRVQWWVRVTGLRILVVLRIRIPPWFQTGRIVIHNSRLGKECGVRIVRDTESVVTWVPDRDEGWWSR